jgi:hypothetical protein
MGMEESTTYQYILRQGEERAMRGMILRQGEFRFSAPSAEQVRCVEKIVDRDRLWKLTDRVLYATSWHDLLA